MSEERQSATGEIMEVLLAFRDAVELQFARVFTELAPKSDLESLRYDMNRRFDRVDAHFDKIDARFDHIDGRFAAIEERKR